MEKLSTQSPENHTTTHYMNGTVEPIGLDQNVPIAERAGLGNVRPRSTSFPLLPDGFAGRGGDLRSACISGKGDEVDRAPYLGYGGTTVPGLRNPPRRPRNGLNTLDIHSLGDLPILRSPHIFRNHCKLWRICILPSPRDLRSLHDLGNIRRTCGVIDPRLNLSPK